MLHMFIQHTHCLNLQGTTLPLNNALYAIEFDSLYDMLACEMHHEQQQQTYIILYKYIYGTMHVMPVVV